MHPRNLGVKLFKYFIDREGVHVFEEKISAIRGKTVPKDTTELQIFLALTVYYRLIINNFATISAAPYPATSEIRRSIG